MSQFADALAAGYTKQEIVTFLRERPGYDKRINEALSSGYSEDEVVDYLHRQEFKEINPQADDADLDHLVKDSIATAKKPRLTPEEYHQKRVSNYRKAGSDMEGAERAVAFDERLEDTLQKRQNGLSASVRGDIGAQGIKQNQEWRDANQKLQRDAGRERTWGEAAKDVGVQLLEGGQNIAGAVPDLIAPDSEWADFHHKAAKFWNSKQSEPIKARMQLAGQAIDQAGEDGVIDQVVEAASQYWDDPVLASRFVVTNLPSMIPGIAAVKLARAGALARGATAARATAAGTVAGGAVNAGLNAGGARGDAYEDILQTLVKQGMDEGQAREIAKRESIVPAMVGGVAGAVSGSTGLERAFAGGLGRPIMAATTELLGEQAEEVLPKLTTNLVAGRHDDRSAGKDVGRTMVETAIGSGPGAVLAGGMEAFGAGKKPGANPRPIDDVVSDLFVDDTPPMVAPANAGAQPVDAGGFGVGRTQPDQMSEFASFVDEERADIANRRVNLAERQAEQEIANIEQRIPSDVETKDAQVADARIRSEQEQRIADIDQAMRTPNPPAAFAALRANRNMPVLPEDAEIIKRRMASAQAFQGQPEQQPEVVASLPDGGESDFSMSGMVPERVDHVPQVSTVSDAERFARIDKALADGFKPQGKALVHPKTGKKINLNVAERDHLAKVRRGEVTPTDTQQGALNAFGIGEYSPDSAPAEGGQGGRADQGGGGSLAQGFGGEPGRSDPAAPGSGGRQAGTVGDAGEIDVSGLTFKTAKGSTYRVNKDGTTTRNKAARSDVGHEGDFGEKEPSQATLYVDEDGLNALGEFQTHGGMGKRIAKTGDGRYGIQYDDGRFERRTMTDVHLSPKVGLFPVELWKDGAVVHFGNAITEVGGSVDTAAHAASTSPNNNLDEPTEAQKKAGNYAKGHVKVSGLDISIENPEGSTRSGTDPNGKPWSVSMKSHYGYILGTVGKDKDHIDVFVKPGTAEDWNGTAFVVDQVRPDTGEFDEHKIMMGFGSIEEAKAAYRENYTKGWAGLKTISATPMSEFKTWLKDGDTRKPFKQGVADAKPSGTSIANKKRLTVEFGGQEYEVASFKDAAEKWGRFVGASQGGVSQVGNGVVIKENGRPVARVSYNGRIWDMDDNEIVTDDASATYPGERKDRDDFDGDAEWAAWREQLMAAPEETTNAINNSGEAIPQSEADARVEAWRKTAANQDKRKNAGKIILSLFDYSGAWSQPFQDAGYEVMRVDLKDGVDVSDFSVEYLTESLGLDGSSGEVVGVLAACPCTDFASSGARWWNEKDSDGRTRASVDLVKQTLRTIEFFAPKFWAIENPVGRIEKMTGLAKPRLVFQPHNYGDPYTKRTHIYGLFGANLPTANVEPTEGSKAHKLRGDDPKQKEERSNTPEGFAYAFFMANGDVQPGTEVKPITPKEDTRAKLKAEVEKAKKSTEPRTMGEDGRPSDGKPVMPGDKYKTTTGRETTPYPSQKGEKYASQWLIDNAIAEAKSRGDNFNATVFSGEKPLKRGELAPASRDSMLMYLFGQQPDVVPSILKPLDTTKPATSTETPAGQPAATTKRPDREMDVVLAKRKLQEAAQIAHDAGLTRLASAIKEAATYIGKSSAALRFGPADAGALISRMEKLIEDARANPNKDFDFLKTKPKGENEKLDDAKRLAANRRAAEGKVFVAATASETIQDMAANQSNTDEQFMAGAESDMMMILGDVMQESAGDRDIRDHFSAMMVDGKMTLGKEFYVALRKAAIKARQEAEKAKHRDPMVYQSALEGAQADKAETDGAKVLFKEGFDHALKGMTKSTLTGDDLGFKVEGYEAARKWMKTEEGRAWYEGRPLKKERSTGEALRRHWEMMRKGLDKITISDGKKAWERIQRNTVRADLLPSDILAPDATGGAQRWFADFRGQVGSYKDYFISSLGTHNSNRKYFNADAVWDGRYNIGNEGPFSRRVMPSAEYPDGDTKERLDKALDIARAYQDDLSEIANMLRGKKTLADIKEVIDGDLGGKFPHVFNQAKWANGRNLDSVLDSGRYTWRHRVEMEGMEFKQPDRSKPLVRPRLDRIVRTGLSDYRNGKDVSADEFKKNFGFADVTIGEYVTAQQAKDHLNYAYDAFMDLAEVLGIRPVDISFGGQMHFAIGALGHGKHSAHFSPNHPRPGGGTIPVINLTNTRGDGAVAHEWGHALDYFAGGMEAKPVAHDNAARVVVRGIKALLKRTPHTKENGESIARSFLRGGRFYPHIGRRSPPAEHAKYALRTGYRSERHGTTATDYLNEALKLDGLKSTGSDNAYWSNDAEPLARAFEAFVFDQMKSRGARSDYLVTDWVADGKIGPQQGYRAFPYPRGDERASFNALFRDFSKGLGFKDGRPGVTEDTLNAEDGGPYRKRIGDRNAAYDDVIGRLEEIAEDMRREKDEKKRAEQEEKDRLLFGEQEQGEDYDQTPLAAQDQPPAQTGDAPLSEDDLSALFDEAAAELAEATQEQPDAPAPGEPTQPKTDTLTLEDVDTLLSMLNEARGDGIAIGGTIHGIPSIHDIGGMGKTDHIGYGTFETVGFGQHPDAPGRTEEWRMTWEGGGAMKTLPSGISYTRVRLSGKALAPYPFQQVRQSLERMKSKDKLASEVEKAKAKTTKEAGEALISGRGGKLPSATEQNARIAGELAKEAAKLGVQGIDSALAGLVELFGGNKIKSFPAGFDEEAYAKAKPHFEAALAKFIEAGKTLKDLFKFLIQNFGMGIKPYATQFAKEKGLAANLGEAKPEPDGKQARTSTPSERLGGWVKSRIANRQPITWQELFLMADSEFGGTQAQGVYTPKDAYDAVELGVNMHIMETLSSPSLRHGEVGAISVIRAYQDVLAMLPTQTKRTAEMDEFQQFSTPPTYAYLANWVANIKAGETFLEPSAGIGGLAVFGKVAGAKVVVNELSARRLGVLRSLPFDHFFAENAEHLASILPQDLRPTVVVMNPPFSSTAGRVHGERDTMNGAKHIEEALKYMRDGGRLVAIVGEGMAMDRPAFREWWNKIKQQYNVRANLGIDGSGYAKYGTTFDNQLLVIDKTGPTTGEVITGKVQSPADAVGLLENVRNDRSEATQPAAPAASQRPGGEVAADGGQSARPGLPGQPATGPAATSGVGGGKSSRTGSGSSRTGTSRPDADRDGAGPVGEGGRNPAGPGQRPAGTDGGQDSQGGQRGDAQSGANDGGVTLEQVSDRPQSDFTNAVFEQYTPKKLKITGAKPHNTPLVESSALATVAPPNPTYTPNLPKDLIESGALSDAQLEAVVYAGQAHQQLLENEQRRGFFVGDGTGVGKGREISGIIMDNMRQGRTKAVWISQKKELMEDAKRDFGDIGGDPKVIFGQHKTKGDAKIDQADGILFSTYSLINGDTKATKTAQKAANVMVGMGGAAAKIGKAMKAGQLRDRTKQIVSWLGDNFDGVIVFDEAHNMGNAVAMKGERGNKEPSEQALAAVALQNALPKARIVYVSATGATEVSNLAYATRLGLWGPGTPFANVQAFVSAMSTSVSAMELVAQNLKQMGLYLSRSLSFDGGTPETRVTYDRLEHTMTPAQRDIYNALSGAWQTVLNNIDKALELTGVNKDGKAAAGAASGKKKGAIMSAFWGSHQRFFNQVITALQMPSVIAAVNQDLAAGHAVVMQIVNTNEADQNRALAKLGGQMAGADDGETTEIEELDLTPREQLITFLEKAFPVQKMEVIATTNPDGSVTKSLSPVVDSQGKPVLDADALAMRQETIDMVRQITIPDAPLQMVINEFGPDRVAEITGRGERVIYDDNGKLKTEKRGAHAAANDAQAFKDGKKDILIFSNAGGTGFSFHADRRYKNQKRRKHYVIQPGWSADKAIQGLGRSHRTNQITAPQYVLVTTDVPAQKRFISTIARRLESMGALTMGQRDTAGGTMFKASDNLESKYATMAVDQFFNNMISGRYGDLPPFMDVLKQMGLEKVFDPQTRGANKDGIPSVRQFLNRILSVSLEMQETIMAIFVEEIDSQVELAKKMGAFDDGLKTIHHEGATVKRDEVIANDESTGAETRFYEIDYKTPNEFHDFDKANMEIKAASKGGWFKNKKSGHVIGLLARNTTRTDKYGAVHRLFGVRRTSGNASMIEPEIKYDNMEKLTEGEARALWDAENEKRPDVLDNTINMVVGSILPLWDRFTGEHVNVSRIRLDDGRKLLGRVILPKDVSATLANLNIKSAEAMMSGADLVRAVLNGDVVTFSNNWSAALVTVSNDRRIEITGSWGRAPNFMPGEASEIGVIQERIGWQERYFIPADEQRGGKVMDALMRKKAFNAVKVGKKDDQDDGARMSRSSKQARSRGVHTRDAQAVVDVYKNVNRNAPNIRVMEDVSKAPDGLLAEIDAAGARGDIEGAYWDGEIYIFPQNMSTVERVAAVLTHEGRHFAFKAMKGGALDAILMDIYQTNQAVKSAANSKKKDLGLSNLVEAIEEALADMDPNAFERGDPYGWNRLVAHARLKLKEFVVALRRAGLVDVADWLQDRLNGWTDADVAAMLRNSDRFVRSGRGDGGGGVRMSLRHTPISMTEDRVDRLLRAEAVSHREKHGRAYVAWVNPQDFLDVTTPRGQQDKIISEAGDLRQSDLLDETQPIYLGLGDGDRVVNHEGRHRMAALQRAGVRLAPVVVFTADKNWRELQDIESMYLSPQRHGGGVTGQSGIYLGKMLPLTYSNRGRLIDEFTNARAAVNYSRALNRVGRDFFTEDFSLQNAEPHPTLNGVTRFEVGGKDGEYLGRIDMKMKGDTPAALISIQLKERKQGLGEKIIAGLVGDAGSLYIYDMLPSSVGFWKKMGVRPEIGGQWNHGNGTITQETYRAARPQGGGEIAPGAPQAQAEAGRYRGTEREVAPGELSDQFAQVAWLDAQARDQGHTDIDTLFEKNPDAFLRLAEQWRKAHPVAARFSRRLDNTAPSGPVWDAPVRSSGWENIVYELQDKHIDTRRVVEAIQKSGEYLDPEWNPHLQEQLFHGRAAKGVEDFLGEELRPLTDAMAKAGVSQDDLNAYLHARHAKERNEAMKAINEAREDNDGLSGLSDDEADAVLESFSDNADTMEDLADHVDRMISGTRKLLVGYGLETQETVSGWAEKYEHYVPLHREGFPQTPGTGQGYSIRGKFSKLAAGSHLPVDNILAHVAMQRERAIVRGEKNRVSMALYSLALLNPNKGFWNVDKVATESVTDPDTGLPIVMAGDIGDIKVPRIKGIDKATGQVVYYPDPTYKGRGNVVVTRIGGADYAVIFNERNERAMRMAESLKNLDIDQMHDWLGKFGAVTRYFASINTQYNPVFGIWNLMRDLPMAALNLSSTPITNKRREVMSNTAHALAGIYQDARATRKGEKPRSDWADLWEQFQKDGGQTGYRDLFRASKDRADAIQHMLDPEWWQKTWPGKVATAGGILAVPEKVLVDKAGRAMFDWLSDFNLTMENAIRLAAYKVALDEGMDRQEAAALAKNLTVNFNKKGRSSTSLGALFAFFNASVQGTARIAETIYQDGKITKAGQAIIFGGITMGAMQSLALALAGFDDDEPPEWIKERSLVIPVPGTDKGYVAYPYPLGYHLLPNLGRHLMEFMLSGFEDPGKRASNLMATAMNAFNPLGSSTPAQMLTPTVFDPLVALAENQDFTGKPIYMEDISRLRPTPGESRAKDSATMIGKGMAIAANRLTGGTKYTPGWFSPTPDQIDYLIGQLTGGVGREVGKLEQSVTGLVTGDLAPMYKIPILGRLVGSASSESAQRDRFYSNLTELNVLHAELKGRRGERQSAVEFMRDHPELRLLSNAAEIQSRMRLYRKKHEKYDEKLAERIARFNERYAALQDQ